MVGDVDAQYVALLGELHVTVPLLAIGLGNNDLEAGTLDIAEHIEQRGLAVRTVLLALYGGVDDVLGVLLVHKVHHLAARVTGVIERARSDKRLDDAAVRLAGVHALDEVVQVLVRTVRLALVDDCLRHALAHASDAGKAEADALGRSRELLTGLVDVRGQDGDAVVTARGDVVNDLLGLTGVGGKNCRHVLVRVVRLEPSGLHNQNRVAGGVRLVERVGCELENVVPDALGNLALIAVALRAVHPVVVDGLVLAVRPLEDLVGQHLDLLLSNRLTDARVGFALGEAAHLDRDEHDLLLVDHGAVGFAQDAVQARVVGDRRLLAVHTVDVAGNHACAQRARSVQGDKSDHVLVLGGLHVLDGRGHARGLYLEHARGTAKRS